jgi:dinuclear metal center YbgI/SA1388 family protein
MVIKELVEYLETIAPAKYQEDYDNAGLIVGDPMTEIKGVLICLDSTEAVVAEAVEKGCNLIIAHHPIVFRGLKRLNGSNYVERVVMEAIRRDIAIYAIHTNLDNVFYNGVNSKISDQLGLLEQEILAPKTGYPGGLVGAGMIGWLPEAMEEGDFLRFLKDRMQAKCIRHTALSGRPVSKVAVCGGAGGFLLREALQKGADAFVTADYKYHEFFDADGRIVICDIGHYESEHYTIELLFDLISKKMLNFAAHCTKVDTNPIQYFY